VKPKAKRSATAYAEEGLSLKLRERAKRTAVVMMPLVKPDRANQSWSIDFVSERLTSGRRFRILTIVDNYSHECPWLEVDTSMTGYG